MDGIYCNACGAKLNEDPTLLPDQRPPCPHCDSLSRRFERTITSSLSMSDSGTGTDTIVVTGAGAAQPPAQIVTAYSIPDTAQVGTPKVIRGPRRVTDQLVVLGRVLLWLPLAEQPTDGPIRSLWWVQLTEEPSWMVQVVDEIGELLDVGVGDSAIQALVEIVELLLPSNDDIAMVTVHDQAGELLGIGVGDDPIKALASLAELLLPEHPG
jgi:hypothetical protein